MTLLVTSQGHLFIDVGNLDLAPTLCHPVCPILNPNTEHRGKRLPCDISSLWGGQVCLTNNYTNTNKIATVKLRQHFTWLTLHVQ